VSWPGIRLVVFDLDGTLVDSVEDLARAVNAALAQLGARAPLEIESVRRFIGDGARRLMERSVAAARLPVTVDVALPVFVDRYRAHLLETTRLYPGVLETLDALRDRRLAVLTNKPGEMSRAILAGLGVAERFERIWGGGDVPRPKPDPEGLLRLMRECGVGPADTVVVGDSAVDIETARAVAARSVGVTYGFAPEGFAETPPDRLCDDIRELIALLT
jgi:phosphoglycolate phosphatase